MTQFLRGRVFGHCPLSDAPLKQHRRKRDYTANSCEKDTHTNTDTHTLSNNNKKGTTLLSAPVHGFTCVVCTPTKEEEWLDSLAVRTRALLGAENIP